MLTMPRVGILVMVGLVAVASLDAQAPPQAGNVVPGSMTGRVTADGAPVRHARVILLLPPYPQGRTAFSEHVLGRTPVPTLVA